MAACGRAMAKQRRRDAGSGCVMQCPTGDAILQLLRPGQRGDGARYLRYRGGKVLALGGGVMAHVRASGYATRAGVMASDMDSGPRQNEPTACGNCVTANWRAACGK